MPRPPRVYALAAPGDIHPARAGRATTIWPKLSVHVWDAAISRRSAYPADNAVALPSRDSADLAMTLVPAAVVALEEAIT